MTTVGSKMMKSKGKEQDSVAYGMMVPYGSTQLGVASKKSDLDLLCIVPRGITRDDFFGTPYRSEQKPCFRHFPMSMFYHPRDQTYVRKRDIFHIGPLHVSKTRPKADRLTSEEVMKSKRRDSLKTVDDNEPVVDSSFLNLLRESVELNKQQRRQAAKAGPSAFTKVDLNSKETSAGSSVGDQASSHEQQSLHLCGIWDAFAVVTKQSPIIKLRCRNQMDITSTMETSAARADHAGGAGEIEREPEHDDHQGEEQGQGDQAMMSKSNCEEANHVEVDISFVQLQLTPHELQHRGRDRILKSGIELLVGSDQKSISAFQSYTANAQILNLVPKKETFREVLRFLKYWIHCRGLGGTIYAGMSSIGWAILAANICILYPKKNSAGIIRRFFKSILSRMRYFDQSAMFDMDAGDASCAPILADTSKREMRRPDYANDKRTKLYLSFGPQQAIPQEAMTEIFAHLPSNGRGRKQSTVDAVLRRIRQHDSNYACGPVQVITPCYPATNTTHNVTNTSWANVIKPELERAERILDALFHRGGGRNGTGEKRVAKRRKLEISAPETASQESTGVEVGVCEDEDEDVAKETAGDETASEAIVLEQDVIKDDAPSQKNFILSGTPTHDHEDDHTAAEDAGGSTGGDHDVCNRYRTKTRQCEVAPNLWKQLCTPFQFFREFKMYLRLVVVVRHKSMLHPWEGFIESQMRKFYTSLESLAPPEHRLDVRPHPHKFELDRATVDKVIEYTNDVPFYQAGSQQFIGLTLRLLAAPPAPRKSPEQLEQEYTANVIYRSHGMPSSGVMPMPFSGDQGSYAGTTSYNNSMRELQDYHYRPRYFFDVGGSPEESQPRPRISLRMALLEFEQKIRTLYRKTRKSGLFGGKARAGDQPLWEDFPEHDFLIAMEKGETLRHGNFRRQYQ
ncbi:unnamed protein product [Amoebophrya sp. A25]|nr:unnamed protein product [Amoebophrya sp. A25]|eukprot:GSA25T00014640001.1